MYKAISLLWGPLALLWGPLSLLWDPISLSELCYVTLNSFSRLHSRILTLVIEEAVIHAEVWEPPIPPEAEHFLVQKP